jgi:hypothetical protein
MACSKCDRARRLRLRSVGAKIFLPALVATFVSSSIAEAATCVASAEELRKVAPKALSKWTYGPNREGCWYSGEKPVFAKAPPSHSPVPVAPAMTGISEADNRIAEPAKQPWTLEYRWGERFELHSDWSSDRTALQRFLDGCGQSCSGELRLEAQRRIERINHERLEDQLISAGSDRAALARFLADCGTACPADLLTQAETHLDLVRRDETKYREARGNLSMLKAYIALCTICAFSDAARTEIAARPASCGDGFRWEGNQCIRIPTSPLLVAFDPPNVPSAASLWDHNGSVVYLEASTTNSSRKFHFHRPSQRMHAAGARHGKLLFEGNYTGKRYTGTAYVFSGTCGAFPYNVSGPVLDGYRKVSLSGSAPVIDENCEISGQRDTVLEFTLSAGQ